MPLTSSSRKVGLLNACSPADEEEFGTVELDSFFDFFQQVPHPFKLIEYRITEGEFPENPQTCDAYLITGSPKGAYDEDIWIGQLIDFIQCCYKASVKMVGICFGHQVLAHALGGRAEKSPKGWGLGLRDVVVEAERPFMTPALPNGRFYFCHQDQVVKLPAEAERLAGNPFCPNGMFVIGDQMLGIQAHPEFTPQIMDKAIDWFATQSPAERETALHAAKTMGAADNIVLAQWIVNFLT